MNRQTRKTGLFLVISGVLFGGGGGTVAQKLFQQYAINVNWFVITRLFIAGLLLLTVQFLRKNRSQLVGCFFLLTNGSLSQLSVPTLAIV